MAQNWTSIVESNWIFSKLYLLIYIYIERERGRERLGTQFQLYYTSLKRKKMKIIKASIIKNMNESIACYYICWTFVFLFNCCQIKSISAITTCFRSTVSYINLIEITIKIHKYLVHHL